MEKPEILVIEIRYSGNGDTGRVVVLVNYLNFTQRQKTFDYVVGQEVEIYGYTYLCKRNFSGAIVFE